MKAAEQDKAVQRIQTQLIEEVGADAVVVIFSKTKRNTTTTHIHTWGNTLACRGLIEEAYDATMEQEDGTDSDD